MKWNDVFRNTKFDDDQVSKFSPNEDASEFYGYMEDATQTIYQGRKFTS